MVNASGARDEWKILLIGGSSGVGKTVIAQALGGFSKALA
jgi:2-phosphoglycerate kinase